MYLPGRAATSTATTSTCCAWAGTPVAARAARGAWPPCDGAADPADGRATRRGAVPAGGAVARWRPFAAVQQVHHAGATVADGGRPCDRGGAAAGVFDPLLLPAFPHAGGGAGRARISATSTSARSPSPRPASTRATTASGTAACPASPTTSSIRSRSIEYHDHRCRPSDLTTLRGSRARRANTRRKDLELPRVVGSERRESGRHPPAAGADRLRDPGSGVHEHRRHHQRHHLHRRGQGDPALPGHPHRGAGREVRPSPRSPTCSSTASCPPRPSSSAGATC